MTGITRYPTPDVVVRSEAFLGEGPVWDHRSNALCWVDLDAGLLMEESLSTGAQEVSSVGTPLGAVAPLSVGSGFVVAVREGLGFWEAGELIIADDTFQGLGGLRMNDAKCDSRGRLWAGSTDLDYRKGRGTLHRWDGVDDSTAMLTGLTLPNGLGWSPDDDVMYLVDSIPGLLLSASFDADTGTVGKFSTLAGIGGGLPDGIAVDSDGCLWVAVWGGAEVRRLDVTGRLVGIVPMPVSQPTSCAFGPDGTLYITSAARGLSDGERGQQPEAGCVFALPTVTSGVPVAPFNG